MDKQTLKNYFKANLAYVRLQGGYTQDTFAKLLKVNRSNIAAQEEGRAFNILTLWQMHKLTGLHIETFLSIDLEKNKTPITMTGVPEQK